MIIIYLTSVGKGIAFGRAWVGGLQIKFRGMVYFSIIANSVIKMINWV